MNKKTIDIRELERIEAVVENITTQELSPYGADNILNFSDITNRVIVIPYGIALFICRNVDDPSTLNYEDITKLTKEILNRKRVFYKNYNIKNRVPLRSYEEAHAIRYEHFYI